MRLVVTKGKTEVADVGVGILCRRYSDLEDDAIARREATRGWIRRARRDAVLPADIASGDRNSTTAGSQATTRALVNLVID